MVLTASVTIRLWLTEERHAPTPALDRDGYPVALGGQWSSPLPAAVEVVRADTAGREGGEPLYSERLRITIDYDPPLVGCERLELGEREYVIRESRVLRAVDKIQLTAERQRRTGSRVLNDGY